MGNKKGHTESMDAMAKDNLEKTDERKAQYDAESDAQRHRNVDGKAMNAMKIRDLRAANEKKSAAMRVDNEAEIVEMRRLGAEGDAEHSAWMGGLRVKNKQKMAKMESDGQRALSGMKMRGRGDELRHKNECAEVNASHDADMAQIEQKHQSDLSAARQNRADNLWRHNDRMNAMDAQHKHVPNAFLANSFMFLWLCLCLLFGGVLSDRLTYVRTMKCSALGLALAAIPSFALVNGFGGVWPMIFVQFVLGVGLGAFGGPMQLMMVDSIDDVAVRFCAMGTAYNLCQALFGGTAPIFAELMQKAHLTLVGLYLCALAALAFGCLWLNGKSTRNTK